MSSTLKTNTNDQPVGAEEQPSQNGSTTTRLHHFVSPSEKAQCVEKSPDHIIIPHCNNPEGKTCVMQYTTLFRLLKDADPNFPEDYCELVITEGDPSKYKSGTFYVRDSREKPEDGEPRNDSEEDQEKYLSLIERTYYVLS